MFLSANYLTRSNNKIDESFKKVDNIEKLIIDNVNRIKSINDICEKKLLLSLLSNSKSFKYYKCVNN